MADHKSGRSGFSRRRLLGGAAGLGAAGLGAAGVGVGIGWSAADAAASEKTHGSSTVPFYGANQAGVTTAPPAHAQFVGINLVEGANRDTLAGILNVWTQDAARLTAARPALADTEPELSATAARLTVTVGLGERGFAIADRTDRKPRSIRALPAFAIDRLDERAWGQTDLLLQVCSDDPVTVAHTVRVLTKNVRSQVVIMWSQKGFRNARGSLAPDVTMRNLMGQVDGTVNPHTGSEFDALVWADGTDGQPWFAGGTTLVLRRISMQLDTWEELDPRGRELTVGRTLGTGAPLTGTAENDEPDFEATSFGIPVIPPSSHIARAHQRNGNERFLRRAYNYDDPPGPGQTSNSGLIFASYQRDIDTQFLPVQQRLAEHDALNEWTSPIGSAVYAILPGTDEDGFLGSTLL